MTEREPYIQGLHSVGEDGRCGRPRRRHEGG